MASYKSWVVLWLRLAGGLLAVFLLGAGLTFQRGERVAAASSAGLDAVALSEPTLYPVTTPTLSQPAYPGSATTATAVIPTAIINLPVTATATQAPTITLTAPAGIFLTEDAQMKESQVTQPAGSTAAPAQVTSIAETPTLENTPTAATAAAALKSDQQMGGFTMDWGFFWIGFAIPVLAGCGVVLYLLDRNPGMFTKR